MGQEGWICVPLGLGISVCTLGCKHCASVLVRGLSTWYFVLLSIIVIPECFLKQQVSDICCFVRLLLFVWAQCFPWPQACVCMGEKTNRSVSWAPTCDAVIWYSQALVTFRE